MGVEGDEVSDFDELGRRIPDPDELREAWEERRRNFNGCKCGRPDWPGQCPGWRNCPVARGECDE